MDPNAIIEIIRLGLLLALEIVRDMPPEQKAKFWEQHAQWQAFWEKVLNGLPHGGTP